MIRETMDTPVMPMSMEAEQGVLGGLLLDNRKWELVADLVTADMFSAESHADIFETIKSRIDSGEPADVLTVSESLDAAGGHRTIAYLAELAQNTPSAANIAFYARIVRDRAAQRRMMDAGMQVMEIAADLSIGSLDERMALAASALERIQTHGEVKDGAEIGMADAMQAALGKILSRIDSDGALGGLPTGMAALDDAIDGLHPGELIVVAGRPSMGKSCLAEMIARTNAKARHAVRFHTYEMPACDVVMRSAAADMGIPLENIRKARMERHELDRFMVFSSRQEGWQIVFDEDTGANVDRIAMRARRQKRKSGLDLLVVDHLHLMPYRGDNETRGLGEITSSLKRLARDLQIPVVLVAQLNREAGKNAGRRPTLTDLRGSGAIEQDADVIVFCHRPHYYDDSKPASEAELIVAKSRNGPVGTLGVGWRGDFVRFQDQPDYDWQPAPRVVARQREEEYL